MAAFFSKFEVAFIVLVEPGAPVNDFPDSFGTFPDDDFDDRRITEAVTGNQRVFNMLFKTVTLQVSDARNPSLRILGVCLVCLRFGNDQYFPIRAMPGDLERITQTRDAGTDNQKICL